MVMRQIKIKRIKIAIFVFFFATLILSTFGSCRRGGDADVNDSIDTLETEDSTKVSHQDIKVNIYIENSGSMDGFVKGRTNFKNDIGYLLVSIKCHYGEDNVKMYFIHNDVHEDLTTSELSSGKELADLAQWIDVEWKKEPRGSNTKLNNIFKAILERTNDETVSILISDCIYSIGKNGNTIDLLDHEKNTTIDAFLTRSKRGNRTLSTSIYRMLSAFNGKYYPYTGDKDSFYYRGDLPYYICVFANNDVMNDFCSKVTISDKKVYNGYKNRYTISHSSTEEPYWTILPLTNKKGRFQKIREKNCVDKVHGIDNVERDRNGVLSFCVAVDMSGVNVQEDYLLNPDNYVLDNTRYAITSITPFNKEEINPSDLIMLQKSSQMPTHILTIEATGTAICDLGLALERKMPQWIDTFNIMDDTSKEKLENKGNVGSFGLHYWIEGISRAYETLYPGDTTYYNLKITIKK